MQQNHFTLKIGSFATPSRGGVMWKQCLWRGRKALLSSTMMIALSSQNCPRWCWRSRKKTICPPPIWYLCSCCFFCWRSLFIWGPCVVVWHSYDHHCNTSSRLRWRVSAGQLCDLQSRLIHVSSRTAIYGWSTVVDDATALRWSQEGRSTRAHSFVYHTICSLIRLVFITSTSHLVYYSTMTSLDL